MLGVAHVAPGTVWNGLRTLWHPVEQLLRSLFYFPSDALSMPVLECAGLLSPCKAEAQMVSLGGGHTPLNFHALSRRAVNQVLSSRFRIGSKRGIPSLV